MITSEQVKTWKQELGIAISNKHWKLALKLCSWLRYALLQGGISDPEVEEAHRMAKEALVEQETGEDTWKEREERLRRLKNLAMFQITSGDWVQSLDSIEALLQSGAKPQEAINLLQELKARSATLLSLPYRQTNPRAETLRRRFDELTELVNTDQL